MEREVFREKLCEVIREAIKNELCDDVIAVELKRVNNTFMYGIGAMTRRDLNKSGIFEDLYEELLKKMFGKP